jgi:DNA repair protein RadD
LPKIADFKVDRVEYGVHNKAGKPPSMKVTYFAGLRKFSQWICFEHQSYAAHRAKLWWDERAPGPCPQTVAEALTRISDIKTPSLIKVWINTEHPEVLGYEF